MLAKGQYNFTYLAASEWLGKDTTIFKFGEVVLMQLAINQFITDFPVPVGF